MNTEELNQVRYYASREMCERLDISDSTLRKWCISLEKNGYTFTRGEQNRRLFLNQDLEALDHLKLLVQGKKMSLENATIIITSRYNESRSSTGTPSVLEENNNEGEIINKLYEHIKKQDQFIEKQEQFNQELLKRLDKQAEYINNRLDKRDKSLLNTMDQLMQQRKEEMKLLEQATSQKDNWFTRMFKK